MVGRSLRRCGVRGLTDKQIAEIRALAVASAEAQGLPAKVEDASILGQVAALIRPGLAAPDEADARGVKRVPPRDGRSDDSVVEDSGHDRGLAA
jgi:hypothetical protein